MQTARSKHAFEKILDEDVSSAEWIRTLFNGQGTSSTVIASSGVFGEQGVPAASGSTKR